MIRAFRRLIEKIHVVDAVDALRACEANSVEIHSDNADFNGLPNCAVTVTGAWTDWRPVTFRSESVLGCLQDALVARDEAFARGIE